ncbi:MFS transporter [Agriterribacter sp.]|uniref:MFS transporter n=1 Tax=Agriterribacter sp. TaxID=2821509 RepID=UPI002CA2A128|nr:MFS transporter [Agriterribacter sp.]HRO46812.1 MFS transporter [Agriterribacter sp.]HRQ15579.1 MFS transporter [Agriterribacter sp.]
MKRNEAKEMTISMEQAAQQTVFPILFAISFSHLLNDTIQSIIPAIYPQLKDAFSLSFVQIGLITLTFQLAASLLQPLVGLYTDKKPQPFSLATGMAFTLTGLVLLANVGSFPGVLLSVGLIGVGSSVFHPEASKVAYMAAGPRRGLAQSIFQVGGNAGSAIGPLLAAFIILPYGRHSISWFSVIALLAIFVLWRVGLWYSASYLHISKKARGAVIPHHLSKNKVVASIVILLLLIFSKYFYMAGISSYFTFYVIHKFGVGIQQSQLYLFVFLVAVAAGTLAGGPIGDRIGRKYVIWGSILGVAPFSLVLPYANLFWTGILIFIIGVILASAFSAILVYAQELLPGKVGMVSGLFFGFAFGMGGIGSALLGKLADITSIEYVYKVCSFLPLIGLLTGFLPNLKQRKV